MRAALRHLSPPLLEVPLRVDGDAEVRELPEADVRPGCLEAAEGYEKVVPLWPREPPEGCHPLITRRTTPGLLCLCR